MSARVECDGCGKTLNPDRYEIAIKGERANGLVGGYPLPDHEFDWCLNCALIAFTAVKDYEPTT